MTVFTSYRQTARDYGTLYSVWGLNPRPSAHKTDALTNWANRALYVLPIGFSLYQFFLLFILYTLHTIYTLFTFIRTSHHLLFHFTQKLILLTTNKQKTQQHNTTQHNMRLLFFYVFSLAFIHAILLGKIVFAKFYNTRKFCRPSLRYLKTKPRNTPPLYPHKPLQSLQPHTPHNTTLLIYPLPVFNQHYYNRPLIIRI